MAGQAARSSSMPDGAALASTTGLSRGGSIEPGRAGSSDPEPAAGTGASAGGADLADVAMPATGGVSSPAGGTVAAVAASGTGRVRRLGGSDAGSGVTRSVGDGVSSSVARPAASGVGVAATGSDRGRMDVEPDVGRVAALQIASSLWKRIPATPRRPG